MCMFSSCHNPCHILLKLFAKCMCMIYNHIYVLFSFVILTKAVLKVIGPPEIPSDVIYRAKSFSKEMSHVLENSMGGCSGAVSDCQRVLLLAATVLILCVAYKTYMYKYSVYTV